MTTPVVTIAPADGATPAELADALDDILADVAIRLADAEDALREAQRHKQLKAARLSEEDRTAAVRAMQAIRLAKELIAKGARP